MSNLLLKNIHASALVNDTEEVMGVVERKLFGLSENQEVLDKLYQALDRAEQTGIEGIDSWFEKNGSDFEALTRVLPMSELKKVFEKLEKILSEAIFEGFFDLSEINKSRRLYLGRIVSVNLLFSQPFLERVGQTIESMKKFGFTTEVPEEAEEQDGE